MSEKLREALAHCCNVLERVPNASNSPVITIAVINGRKALAEPAPAPSDFERVFTDACDEIGCAHDNEALLEAIASLKKSAVTPQERCDRDDVINDCANVAGEYPPPDGVSDQYQSGFIDATCFIEQAIRNLSHSAFPRADCGGGK